MDDRLVEAINVNSQLKPRSSTLIITSQTSQPYGGREGPKHSINTEVPAINPEIKPRNLDGFIIKEYKIFDPSYAQGVVENYALLRHHKYPVPRTTRYFVEEGKVYLLTSDVREGGKYRLWGFSDSQKERELEELKAMNLDQDKIDLILGHISILLHKTTADGFYLRACYYHIRQNISTGQFDIILLDVDPLKFNHPNTTHPYQVEEKNLYQVSRFRFRLEQALAKTSSSRSSPDT